MDFRNENGVLIARRNGETLRIEAWGKDSLRVRATMFSKFTGNNWALTEAFEKLSFFIFPSPPPKPSLPAG